MAKSAKAPARPRGAGGGKKIGVLVVNLGTPEGTTYWPMRRYLKEFLSDRRVIETPRWLWWPILNLIVLTKRPGPKGRDYRTIWNTKRDESPLKTTSRAQAEKLARRLRDLGPGVAVDWAMRYGHPSIASRIDALHEAGCERLLVVPMYPQYAAATTATVGDKVFDKLKTMRWQPALRIAAPWHDDGVYISALAASLKTALGKLRWKPDVVLASFHGVPKSYVEKGDPYRRHCEETVELLRPAAELGDTELILTFQSRFGPEEWLQPYTDKTVEALAKGGVTSVAIMTPGFTADCLETLEEIGVENADIFRNAGGKNFAAIPCLNDSEPGIDVLEAVTRRELMGWV